MQLISRTRVVWRNAYIAQVLSAGYPFPLRHLASMDTAQLEHAVRRAIRIGAFWRSAEVPLTEAGDFHASFGTGVSNVRFLPGHDGRRLATLSKGIWSVITCWETSVGGAGVRKVAKWSPKSTIITGLVVNSDAESDAVIATSTHAECVSPLGYNIRVCADPLAIGGSALSYYHLRRTRKAKIPCSPWVLSTLP